MQVRLFAGEDIAQLEKDINATLKKVPEEKLAGFEFTSSATSHQAADLKSVERTVYSASLLIKD